MIGAPSFSQPYLCIQLALQSPQKIRSSTLVNLHFSIPSLFVHIIIFTTSTSTPFLYTLSISYLLIFGYSHPNNLHQKHFPYLNHLVNSGCLKGTLGSTEDWHCFNLSLLPQSMTVITGLTITDSFSLRLIKLVYYR